jgi:hypothetical protein
MKLGSFWWLAGVVAAHTDRTVDEPRLQMTVYLLQRLGLPTDYLYSTFFHGLFSEGVHGDLRLLLQMGMATTDETMTTVTVSEDVVMPELEPFREAITLLEQTSPAVLEWTATFRALVARNTSPTDALQRLRRKRGSLAANEVEGLGLRLFDQLRLGSGPIGVPA